ncbi:MAG: SLBB domain-containing protein [Candidatus Marinimicrobia bacterium]|nr:SLBB domain-containing protein [Candidatus Neomarinimicrobiota bacterium]
MRKISFVSFLIIISLNISTQEFDEAYLKSLPEDVREDIKERMDQQKASEEASYRRLSETDSYINKTPNTDDEKDAIFGSQFFNSMQTSFMPVSAPNLDDSYVLDFGDVLLIQLLGQQDSIDSYQLARDGSINLPDIGQINLAGLSLSEASKLIKSKVNQAYIGTDSFISLKNIRDVSVLLAGDVFNPGVYTLNGSSNMLHALNVAGGIGSFGSYRSIKLIRNGKKIDTLDIYDILIEGKFISRNRLRSGDIIFVDPRANVITLEGAFKRPDKYELLAEENLYDAIRYANGLTIDADLNNTFLYRVLDGEVKSIPIASITQFNNIQSRDEDRIFVRKNSFRNVSIEGAVLRPGNYKMIEGQSVFDLIEEAGGYTKNAFPAGAIYLNEEAKTINENALEKLYDDFIDGIIETLQRSASQMDITPLVNLSQQIKDAKPNGRIIVDLLDDSSEIIIKDKDSLVIPEKNNNVFIFGEVQNEGALLYKRGADLEFYLSEASGLKKQANLQSIYIMYPNGKTKQFNRKRNLFASRSQEIVIEPGSVIYVPKKIDDALSSRLTAQAYATILGNISLTLASINSINK